MLYIKLGRTREIAIDSNCVTFLSQCFQWIHKETRCSRSSPYEADPASGRAPLLWLLDWVVPFWTRCIRLVLGSHWPASMLTCAISAFSTFWFWEKSSINIFAFRSAMAAYKSISKQKVNGINRDEDTEKPKNKQRLLMLSSRGITHRYDQSQLYIWTFAKALAATDTF